MKKDAKYELNKSPLSKKTLKDPFQFPEGPR